MKKSIRLYQQFGEKRLEEMLTIDQRVNGLLVNPLFLTHYKGRVFQKSFSEGPASINQRVEHLGIVLRESGVLKYMFMTKYGAFDHNPKTLKEGDIDLTIISNNPELLLTRIKRIVPALKHSQISVSDETTTLLNFASDSQLLDQAYTPEEIKEFLMTWKIPAAEAENSFQYLFKQFATYAIGFDHLECYLRKKGIDITVPERPSNVVVLKR